MTYALDLSGLDLLLGVALRTMGMVGGALVALGLLGLAWRALGAQEDRS